MGYIGVTIQSFTNFLGHPSRERGNISDISRFKPVLAGNLSKLTKHTPDFFVGICDRFFVKIHQYSVATSNVGIWLNCIGCTGLVYLPTFPVKVDPRVGKYTSPMDPMGMTVLRWLLTAKSHKKLAISSINQASSP